MKNIILFLLAALIWGSTWLVIKFQLGVVDPLISIFYRFILAAVILLVYARFSGKNLKFSLGQHLRMAQLGALLFGFNYWLVYLAEMHLKSGLVAVVFSTIIFFNIFNSAIFLKTRISLRVILSALLGFSGVALLFKDELLGFQLSNDNTLAFVLSFIGALTASFGNITSALNQKQKLPVVQTNAFGMLYGSLMMLILALAMGKPLNFDFSFPYISSLVYLALFGSVIAFSSYLTLLGRIGPGKSAYVTLVIPIIALVLSTIFESYQWNLVSGVGVLIILVGNVMVLRKK